MIYLSELFEKYVGWNILRFFLENCDSFFYVNETAQKLSVSPASVSRFLKNLEKDGVVIKKKVGNVLSYKLNNELSLVRQLKIVVFLLKLEEIDFVKKLLDIDDSIVSVVVYGSYASGNYDEKSDVDFLVISGRKKNFINLVQYLEEEMKRSVHIETYNISEWERMPKLNKEFYQSVKENNILLWGGELI